LSQARCARPEFAQISGAGGDDFRQVHEMKQAATLELFSYWNRVRGQRLEPERSELDPGVIRGILADIFILEVDPRLRFPMRIAGTRMSALFNRELKGASFTALWDEMSKKPLQELLHTVIDDRNPAIAGVATAPPERRPLELELLLLPLRHFGKTHARVIGSLTPCAAPSWLGLTQCPALSLNTMRMIRDPDNHAPTAGHPPRYGHLTVHEGGLRGR